MSADLDHMASLWKAGHSMAEIAKSMKLSRCAVAGHISRNRQIFPRRNKPGAGGTAQSRLFLRVDTDVVSSPRIKRPQKVADEPKLKEAPKRASAQKRAPAPALAPITREQARAYDEARRPFSKDLMSIEACECRWWVSESPVMFCAEVTVEGRSWCEHHLQRLKGRGTESERKAASDLKRAA